MAFFPQALYNQDKSFTPLFRLLDDYNNYSRQSDDKTSRPYTRASSLPQWQPNFDVRETAETYELYGELPGVKKEDVSIDFTEPQTLNIRGKSERRYTTGTSPAGQAELCDGKRTTKNARQATVEDEDGDESAPGTPASTTVEVDQPAQAQKPADSGKYWLTERKIGEFSRSFNFPNRVDQDGVSASFQDGILSIIVPKAKKHESRRIVIS